MRFWVDMAMMVASLVASGCAWVLARMKADKSQLVGITERHRDRLEQHERDIAQLTKLLGTLPTVDQLGHVRVEIMGLRGSISEVTAKLDGLHQLQVRLERNAELMGQFLMHERRT
jgi:hypothetical protein